MLFEKSVAVIIFSFIVISAFATDYYKATTTLNVRSGAGINYSVLFSINKGDEVQLISKHNNWYEIKYKAKTGYASSKYLKFSRSEYSTETSNNSQSENTKIIVISIIICVVFIMIYFASKRKQRQKQPQSNISSSSNIQQQRQPRVVVTKSTKNVGLAIFLSIIFPYFGLLYSTISGFFWLFISYLGMWGILFSWTFTIHNDTPIYIGFVLSMIHWLISIIWSGIAARNYNKRIINQAQIN